MPSPLATLLAAAALLAPLAVEARAGSACTAWDARSPDEATAYVTFAVGVRDGRRVARRADTLLRLLALYDAHGVRPELYLTRSAAEAYARERPDLIERLRAGAAVGFLAERARDGEGYARVAAILGAAPGSVLLPPDASGPGLDELLGIYAALGAERVGFATWGARADWRDFRTARPAGAVLAPVDLRAPRDPQWWHVVPGRSAALGARFEALVAGWREACVAASKGDLPAYLVAWLDEDDLHRRGSDAWASYAALVASASARARPVTSADALRATRLCLPAGVGVERGVEYCRGGSRPLLMDVLHPEPTAAPVAPQPASVQGAAPPRAAAPAVVFVHGGAWQGGARDDLPRAAVTLAARGFVVASVDYRLTDEAPFPAQIEDVKCAIRSLRARAAEHGIDPERIGIWGVSAGGHLAALAGTAGDAVDLAGAGGAPERSSRVQAVVDAYGPADLASIAAQLAAAGSSRRPEDAGSPEARLLGAPPHAAPLAARRASPLAYVSSDDPPFLILHGAEDRFVPVAQSQALHAALVAAGVASRLIVVPGAGHGLRGADTEGAVLEFLEQRLAPPPR